MKEGGGTNRVNVVAYLDVWVALHYLLNPGQGQCRVLEIHGFLLGCIYLALPKVAEKVVELGA